jgi:DNA ligase-1
MAKRIGIQLCYPFEESRLLKWAPPYIIQPKLDGERCRAVWDEVLGWQLISSELNIFNSIPHINQALSLSNIPHAVELDGELYRHGYSFEDVHSIASRTVNIHPEHDQLQYHIFDLVDEGLPQWERLRLLRKLEGSFRPGLQLVPMYVAEDLDGILRAYDRIVENGYEGIVVRHMDAGYVRRRSLFVMKFKPKKDDYYEIVGFKQMVDKEGNPKEMLGALICKGDDGTEFSVGSGLNDLLRVEWWPAEKAQELIGKRAHVEYQHITPGRGVPRFPVFVEVVEPESFVNPLL